MTAQTRRALFGDFPMAQALVCFDGSSQALIGFASYSFLWPASGATHTLFVKELFVAESHRGKGLGTLLFEQILQIANSREDCSRVEWTADRNNPTATRFYTAQGFKEDEGKVYYRWSKPEQ
ncbi:hypothetical protein Kisp02_32450 [Kineosporia sp. NBRC 101731]|nr:hypothetical protein Kisp02_32450 [Kineosporia sp. NBRC 101731]